MEETNESSIGWEKLNALSFSCCKVIIANGQHRQRSSKEKWIRMTCFISVVYYNKIREIILKQKSSIYIT